MDRVGEVIEEAFEEGGGGGGIAGRVDFEEDIAGGPVDGDEGEASLFFQCGQMFEIDVDEADRSGLEGAGGRLLGSGPLVEAVAAQTAVDGAARYSGVQAPAHDFGDVVERQAKVAAQFAHQRFFQRAQADGEVPGCVGTVADIAAPPPAPDRLLTDAQFGGEFGNRGCALLDIGAGSWWRWREVSGP